MGKSKRGRFQYSLSTLFVLIAACAVILGVVRFVHQRRQGSLKDSFTGVQVAAMINAYLDANQCAWPKSWNDLKEFYRIHHMIAGGGRHTFAEVRDSWVIDFDADPVELARTKSNPGQPPFHVVRQRHRRPLALPEFDPNLRILWRIRRNAGAQVAAMVIEYMKANDNTWPKSWEDLRRYYDVVLNQAGSHYCPFELARGCVVVDFKADPAELAQAKPPPGERPFLVVYQRYGMTGEGPWDPNQRIFEYLTPDR